MPATEAQVKTALELWNPAVNAVVEELQELRDDRFTIQIGRVLISGATEIETVIREHREQKGRIQQLLEAYNREVEARRKAEAALSEVKQQAVNIARGCVDFCGGYGADQARLEIFHHGMKTVANSLEAWRQDGLENRQVAVVHSIGEAGKS